MYTPDLSGEQCTYSPHWIVNLQFILSVSIPVHLQCTPEVHSPVQLTNTLHPVFFTQCWVHMECTLIARYSVSLHTVNLKSVLSCALCNRSVEFKCTQRCTLHLYCTPKMHLPVHFLIQCAMLVHLPMKYARTIYSISVHTVTSSPRVYYLKLELCDQYCKAPYKGDLRIRVAFCKAVTQLRGRVKCY